MVFVIIKVVESVLRIQIGYWQQQQWLDELCSSKRTNMDYRFLVFLFFSIEFSLLSRFFVDGGATVRSSVRNFKTIIRLIRLSVGNRWFTFYLSHWVGPRTGRWRIPYVQWVASHHARPRSTLHRCCGLVVAFRHRNLLSSSCCYLQQTNNSHHVPF